MKKRRIHITKKQGILIASFVITTIGMAAAAIVSGNSHPDGVRAGMESLGQAAQMDGGAPASGSSGMMTMSDLWATMDTNASDGVVSYSTGSSTYSYGSSYNGSTYPRVDSESQGITLETSAGPFFLPISAAAGPGSSEEDYPRVPNPLLPQP